MLDDIIDERIARKQTAAQLGLETPDSPRDFELLNRLGEGATSLVYKVQHHSAPVVLKIFKPGFEAYANHEAQVLAHLASNHVLGVKIAEKVGPPAALSFPDILEHMDIISSSQMQTLVECLRGAHAAGVVHRDIRPENVMMDSLGEARIVDWGCAVFVTNDTATPWITGTFRYASEEVLEAAIAGSARIPQPKDDLESLVRATLAINTVTIREELANLNQGDFRGARDYWKKRKAANVMYDPFFQAAARCDYETVKRLTFA